MKKDSAALKEFFETLSRGSQALLVEQLVTGCKVPRQTVYNWKHGLCRIPELHKDKIEEIIGKQIFDKPIVCQK